MTPKGGKIDSNLWRIYKPLAATYKIELISVEIVSKGILPKTSNAEFKSVLLVAELLNTL